VAGRNPHRIWSVAVAATMLVGLSGCANRPGADASYVGREWRLTMVTDGSTSVPISASLDATMDLLDDGHIRVDDTVNALSGQFTTTADGFDVTNSGTTAEGYVGGDPQVSAAIKGFRALMYTSDGTTFEPHARNTVISADGEHLVVDAESLRMDFDYAGPARTSKSG
jgi:hypothetical protein